MKSTFIVRTEYELGTQIEATLTIDGETATDFITAAYCVGLALGFADRGLTNAMRDVANEHDSR